MNEEDEAFEELAKRQGDWGMQGSRKHQIMRYVETLQRPWVKLTDREIDELWMSHHDDFGNPLSATGYERAIEAKLKEKNT